VKKKDHVCGHKNIIAIPDDLAEILRNQFALNVEANTSALGRSALFDEWCSTNENDLSFGSLGAFWKANLEGKNCLLVCTENDNVNIKRFNEKIKSLIDCKQPTRVLIILPTQIFQKLALPPRKVLELASVPTTFPLIRPEEAENSTFSTNETFSIILTLNQESMLIDPIHWESFKTNFLLWGGKYCKNIEISSVTDKLFNERIPLTHRPRARGSSAPSSGVYHFFDTRSTPVTETNHLASCGIPVHQAKIIHKINSHNRCLSMIGILPNQIKFLCKNNEQGNQVFEELARELFWKGYAIWKKRKRLMSYFWKKIAPEEWKKSSEKKQKKQVNRATKTKKRKINAKDYQCQNPFHFLKKHRDLSHKLPTPCYCSHVSRKATPPRFLDLRNMVTNNNTVSFTTRGSRER